MNLIKNQQPDTDKIYIYVKDPFKSKKQLNTNRRQKVGIKMLKNPKAFIDYSQAIDNVNENLEEYNPKRKKRILMFDVMIADMNTNNN